MTKPTKLPTVADLQKHILDLTNAFNVRLIWSPSIFPPHYAASLQNHETGVKGIAIPLITDHATYAVALHELGHLLGPGGCVRPEGDPREGTVPRGILLHEEEAAWAWAEYMALDWTVAMEQVKTLALKSYQTNYRERRGCS